MDDLSPSLLDQLFRAGSLSPQHLAILREGGCLPTVADPLDLDHTANHDGGWDDGGELEPDDVTDLDAGSAKKRGGGGRQSRGADLKAEQLSNMLEEVYAERVGVIEPIIALAEVSDRTPAAALRWLRRQKAKDLYASLCNGLDSAELKVKDLWDFLGIDDFDTAGDGWPGPAPQSYRGLVRAARMGQSDAPMAYKWLLKHDAVAAVYDLLVAQRRLTEAVALVHEHEPVMLRENLRKHSHPLAFRTLLILYNVDHTANRVGKGSSYGQIQLVTPQRDDELWRRAWEQAVSMNEREVLRLLGSLHKVQTRSEGEVVELRLLCPVAWKGLVYRYLG